MAFSHPASACHRKPTLKVTNDAPGSNEPGTCSTEIPADALVREKTVGNTPASSYHVRWKCHQGAGTGRDLGVGLPGTDEEHDGFEPCPVLSGVFSEFSFPVNSYLVQSKQLRIDGSECPLLNVPQLYRLGVVSCTVCEPFFGSSYSQDSPELRDLKYKTPLVADTLAPELTL